MSNVMLEAKQVSKRFAEGESFLEVLKGVSLSVNKGETIAIVGASGSGKTTLLQILGGLDRPSDGEVSFDGKSIVSMSNNELAQFRNRSLGFVYQFHHLLPEFSALENIAMPLLIGGSQKLAAFEKAAELLEQVGLQDRAKHRPQALSGGERQRVAIARALVCEPKCVLADEPTGNLDQAIGTQTIDLMLDLNRKHQAALVVVTHDLSIANRMDKQLELKRGVIVTAA